MPCPARTSQRSVEGSTWASTAIFNASETLVENEAEKPPLLSLNRQDIMIPYSYSYNAPLSLHPMLPSIPPHQPRIHHAPKQQHFSQTRSELIPAQSHSLPLGLRRFRSDAAVDFRFLGVMVGILIGLLV
jgi:hypothetical protein